MSKTNANNENLTTQLENINVEMNEVKENEGIVEENKKYLEQKKSKKNLSSKFLYISSVVFLGFLLFNVYDTNTYLNELISVGSIDPSTQAKDIVSYYIGTCAPYAYYAVSTWALGCLLSNASKMQATLNKITK